MGRYVGIIKKTPSGTAFGEIISDQVSGLSAFFDEAAGKRSTGPGGMIKGAKVSFEIGSNGRAVNIIRSYSNNTKTGRNKHFQSIPG
ncbi:MAG: hypothetical protein Q7R76_00365 [Candidatus Woesearchaeota archaeon]|nr:hypothetical protein [Candidatus Woesearchaeota archaeon]